MNALGRDIQPGERLVIKKERMLPKYQELHHRIFVAEDGFGLHAENSGRKIIGHFMIDGHQCYIMGNEIDVEETKILQSTLSAAVTA
jgi:hypothetical protein